MRHYLLITTCNEAEASEQLASMLVNDNLAACVTVLPGARSFYQWQGKLEKENEYVLLIKSREDRLAELEQRLQEVHPYELPELIAVPVETGSAAYLGWIDKQLDK